MRKAARCKTRVGQLTVSTFNVRTLAFNGKNGLAHAEEYWKSAGKTAEMPSDYRRPDETAKTGSQQRGTPYPAVVLAEV